jgi:EAL domain-containing protein (putative c-di-GMP-specific phosphodiesterase class I)/GGDEF domain-containing protein
MGRSRFLNDLDGCLARAMRQELNGPVALLIAEADAFELLCGWYGYREVSALLQQAELRMHARLHNMASTLGSACLFERTEPAGFAIALFGMLASDAAGIAERLRAELRGPWKIGGESREIGFSLGYAQLDTVLDADTLYALARSALEQAFANGSLVQAAHEEELVRHERARVLGRSLQRAIAQGELRLEYQPIVDLDDMTVAGIEALVRWDHPVLGRVSPVDFIPVAARDGFLGELGDWVLRNACEEFVGLRRQGPLHRLQFLSVNVSRQDLADPAMADKVIAAVRGAQMEPGQLLLEITESELATDPLRVARTLRQIRSRGVRIAIDDFGVGHSSLASLHELPVDVLKLDRSFLCQSLAGRKGRDLFAIAHAVVNLAHSVELQVVAEGVESVDQLTLLRSLHCPLAQGYALCRPVPAVSLMSCCAGLAAMR